MRRLQEDGRILHRNSEWVKAIHASGRIENYDWGPVYQALRYAANASAPGYLWHEVQRVCVPAANLTWVETQPWVSHPG